MTKNLGALLLLCFGLAFCGRITAAEAGPDLLTPAERAWLAQHPEIVLGVGEEWAPSVVKNANGRFGGFAFDQLDLLNRKLGTHIRLEVGPWHAMVEKAETGRLAGLNLSVPVEQRKAHFLFTQTFNANHYFIYLHTGEPAPRAGLDGLRGRKLTVTANGVTGAVLLVGHGSAGDLAQATATAAADGGTVTVAGLPASFDLTSVTANTPAGFNTATAFNLVFPCPFAIAALDDHPLATLLHYNSAAPAMLQAQTNIGVNVSAGVITLTKTGLVAGTAARWKALIQ